MNKHIKQGVNVVFAVLWVVIVLAVGACSPNPESPENTEAIRITNIPAIVDISPTVKGKPVYKVYVQLSKGTTASDGYVAKGEAKLTAGQTEVTITDLKDPAGNPWKGVGYANECVVISPKTVNTIADIDAHAGTIGPSSTPTVVFNWANMYPKGWINEDDYKKLYKDIIVPDTDIGGLKN
jgi:hypothetical protein